MSVMEAFPAPQRRFSLWKDREPEQKATRQEPVWRPLVPTTLDRAASWLPQATTDQRRELNPTTLDRKRRRALVASIRSEVTLGPPRPFREIVHDRAAQFKIMTAMVAMHLDDQWRVGLFKQLDFLLEHDDWPEDVPLPSAESFGTFLAALVFLKPIKRPSFGVTDEGQLVGTWLDGAARLTIEFTDPNLLRWSATQRLDGRSEALAGRTPIDRLLQNLSAYGPSRWFAKNA